MSTHTRHAVWAIGIALASSASIGSARADDKDASQNARPGQDETTKTQTPALKDKSTAATPTKPKTKIKAKSGAADEEKQKQPEAEEKGVVGNAAETVQKVNEDADKAAAKANESVVGTEAHQTNEERARDPRLRPKTDKEAKQAAEAVGRATTTAAEYVATAVEDTTRSTDKPGAYEPFAIGMNPLGVIVGGRYSFQAEWAPVTHHVILVSPHFIHTSADIATSPSTMDSQTFTGVGGELGYRYYTGHRGMNGVFIGPSLIGGVYNASILGRDQAFTDFGFAADVGFKGLIANHLALGGGVGLEYLHVSHDFGDLPTGQAAIASSGVKPRLLFEVGYAF
jgi:hypothetical protein